MHTFSKIGKMEDGRDVVVTINHNGDCSGDAILDVRTGTTGHSFEMRVPAKILVAFARNMTVHDAIEALENLLVSED